MTKPPRIVTARPPSRIKSKAQAAAIEPKAGRVVYAPKRRSLTLDELILMDGKPKPANDAD